MKKPSQFESILFLLCVAILIVLAGVLFVFADETEDETTEATSEEDYLCAQTMVDQGYEVVSSYEEFLNEYFLIDNPSSNQVEEAMDYYRYVEDTLMNLYNSSMGVQLSGKALDSASSETTYCSTIRDQYIDYARMLLQKQALSSANTKTVFEVVDGLKVMNEDLEEFSEVFMETFPGIFNQMNSALPCYARQCITQ